MLKCKIFVFTWFLSSMPLFSSYSALEVEKFELKVPTYPRSLSFEPTITADQYKKAVQSTPLIQIAPQLGIDLSTYEFPSQFLACNFSESSFIKSTIDSVVFDFSNFNKAKFIEFSSKVPRFIGANLSNALLKDCKMIATDFYGILARNMTFDGGDFTNSRFQNIDLTTATFKNKVILNGCLFTGCKMTEATYKYITENSDARIDGAELVQ